ncbi:Membrane-bound lytic murein transglycosylase B precursor [hydrothermal vent metagenome]|uniref:Membrane-bound lytic murein transglycosylase B n=1 Tax=hydrothermal vent metagenome TaxID=652676 RepID=A0A1W1CP84_9ZZZZ
MAKEPISPVEYNFLAKKEVKSFINRMVKRHHFSRAYVTNILKNSKLDQETLDRYTGKHKKGKTDGTWERYKNHVLDPISLQKAKDFKQNYYQTLARASEEYSVDLDYIVAFIGVESKFGEYTGDYHIIDALTTLAFHKNRMKKFFKSELENLFLLSREENRAIEDMYGSFAGAMGCVQQVPSVQRKFGMDYNMDGIKDPWDLEDCIGIIASFMNRKGWTKGGVVAVPTNFKGKRFKKLKTSHKRKYSTKVLRKYGIKPIEPFNEKKAYLLKTKSKTHDDIWMGGKNFRVLTKYNNSTSYGLAIYLIAESIKN